jgi:enoyl-CoA hydratase/carnithine racemase
LEGDARIVSPFFFDSGLSDTVTPTPPTSSAVACAPAVLLVEQQDAIAILTLNNPSARNALSETMLAALQDALDAAQQDNAVRAIVLAANGPAFCAGHDLKELSGRRGDADKGAAYFRTIMQQCAVLMQAIVACPKPVIAAVEGPASAAGCQLVATCDLAVASESASFATPGVNIGLFCSTPMVALSRNVSRKQAMEMLLLGEMLAAEDAKTYGLVNRVVAKGSARTTALAMAAAVASKSPLTVAIGKRAFYEQLEIGLADAYAHTAELMVHNMLTRDAAEGIGAFIEKREPKWTGQ